MLNRKQAIIIRHHLLKAIRHYFDNKNYIEVQTPKIVKTTSGEAETQPISLSFQDDRNTTHNGYLITSPECQIKKILAQGIDNAYEITPCFRNREPLASQFHNMEFSMLEWYKKNANYLDIIQEMESLIGYLYEFLSPIFPDKIIKPSEPVFIHTSIKTLFKEVLDFSITTPSSYTELFELAKKLGLAPHPSLDTVFFDIFLNFLEPTLEKNKFTFILDYPYFQAAFGIINPKTPSFAERFELYFGQLELANGYSELCDTEEYRRRLWSLNKDFIPDQELMTSLDIIKKAGGVALGLDRLMMALVKSQNMAEVQSVNWN